MEANVSEMVINGIVYVPKGTEKEMAGKRDGLKYVIVRTCSAGVFAGYIESKQGQEVVLRNARRLWMWVGAASLSQLAIDGVAKPKECKFPEAVDKVELLQAIEILDVTEKSKNSIEATPIWKM
jgi:hypothetical protein